jgi:hypothetical protein
LTTKKFTVEFYEEYLGHTLEGTADGQTIKFRGFLICKGDGHALFLYFLTEDSPVPKCSYLPAYKLGTIYLPFKDMPSYVDMLRNEKPVYAYLNSDNPQWNHLSTGIEPTGETEKSNPPKISAVEFGWRGI